MVVQRCSLRYMGVNEQKGFESCSRMCGAGDADTFTTRERERERKRERERAPTSCFVFEPLHRHQHGLLLVQLALQEGVPLDGLVQTALEVLQRHDGGPGDGEEGIIQQKMYQRFIYCMHLLNLDPMKTSWLSRRSLHNKQFY